MSQSRSSHSEQRTTWFAGRVQGVGFRYTTQRIAAGYRIGGYVQNLDDGRVLVVAEGETSELDGFFDELRSTMEYYIHSEQSQVAPATSAFTGFSVRR